MILRRIQYEFMKRAGARMLTRLDSFEKQRKRKKRGAKQTKNVFGPPLECVNKLRDLMTEYYLRGRYADGAVPVAWVTSGFPAELLTPLGFHLVYPENHAALCGTRRMASGLCGAAEQKGYDLCLCSYARTDFGSILSGKTPVGRLPKPDLLACCTNICQTVLYWYKMLANHFNVPLALVDTPFVYGTCHERDLAYVKDQLEELILIAQQISGRTSHPEELTQTLALASEGTKLWGDCLALSKTRPAPWTGIDAFFHMAPIVTLRGTKACNAYYRELLHELQERVSLGFGGIQKEQHRLMWDNLPIWYYVRELSTLLAEQHCNIVVTTYTNAWAEAGKNIRAEHPYDSLALAYTKIILNMDLRDRLDLMARLSKEYAVDGAILHSDRSCKPYSVGQIDLKTQLAEKLGIKALLLDADHNDERVFAKKPNQTRIQAFVESL